MNKMMAISEGLQGFVMANKKKKKKAQLRLKSQL